LNQSTVPSFLIFILSIGLIASSCNSGTGQADQGEQEELVVAKYQNIDVAQFDKMRKNSAYVVLDVRSPDEIEAGKVAAAVELDYFDDAFENELGKLDKDKQYLVYCAAGGRSSKSADIMIDMGFTKVYNLVGGYTSWSAAHPNNKD